MTFESWWEYHGQRSLSFDAKQWALAGWKGHELHVGEVIDAGVPLLEYRDIKIADIPAGSTIDMRIASQYAEESLRLGRPLTREEVLAIQSSPENKEKK